jgi:L-lactate permease
MVVQNFLCQGFVGGELPAMTSTVVELVEVVAAVNSWNR